MINKKEIIALHKQGDSIKRIAQKYGISEGTVRKVLITAKEEIKNSAKAKKILDDYDAGMSQKEIAQKYGITEHAVNSFLPYTKVSYRCPSKITIKRKQAGLTQKQLAKLLEVPQSTVGRWENGTYKPSAKNLQKIMKVLDCKIEDLLE